MIRNRLSYSVSKVLFGDRKQFGTSPDVDSNDWLIWQEKAYTDFYPKTQQKGIGDLVCKMAYSVISRIEFSSKRVLEVGPGFIRHLPYVKVKPLEYILCDINPYFLEMARNQLCDAYIPCTTYLINHEGSGRLPLRSGSLDIIISFNSLEHLYPLNNYLDEFKRVLKPGGKLVGGIPCEGGLAWGLGRFLTTRRYVHKNYKINYDKIICWEHPNFADFIIDRLDAHFKRDHLKLHPFSWLPMDLNLVASFIYTRS